MTEDWRTIIPSLRFLKSKLGLTVMSRRDISVIRASCPESSLVFCRLVGPRIENKAQGRKHRSAARKRTRPKMGSIAVQAADPQSSSVARKRKSRKKKISDSVTITYVVRKRAIQPARLLCSTAWLQIKLSIERCLPQVTRPVRAQACAGAQPRSRQRQEPEPGRAGSGPGECRGRRCQWSWHEDAGPPAQIADEER